MNTKQAIKKARAILKEKQRAANQHANQVVLCENWNETLEGQLIIVLKEKDNA